MGYKMNGFSGFGNSPAKQKQKGNLKDIGMAVMMAAEHTPGRTAKLVKPSSFSDAFAKARKEQGASGTFTWNGKKYSTARKDDPSVAGQFLSPDLKDVDSGQQFTDPHGHVKKDKEGFVEDRDYIHHKGKITGTK